jgi:outer membrane protein assembly factor BamB
MPRLWLGIVVILGTAVGLTSRDSSASEPPSAEWPTYRADAGRTGYTPHGLPDDLALCWTYRGVHPPMPAWPESPRLTFDLAYQPVAAGGLVVFGSSADDKVYALDAESGAVRWTYFTEGPVRFAPAVWRDRVLVASDDGWLVCLATADGHPLWKLRGGPRPDMLLGNDRMISRWPARGGPAVVGDVVYFGAGIWPSEGIYLYAVDAATGKVLWCNDTSGSIEMNQPHPTARARSGVAAQGYLVADEGRLFVPTGRAVPALFDRASGEFRSFPLQQYGKLGGADVVAFDGHHYSQGVLFSSDPDAKPQAIGSQIAVHPEFVLACVKGQLAARDRKSLWAAKETVDRTGKKAVVKSLAKPLWIVPLPHDGDAGLIVAANRAVVAGRDRVSLVDLAAKKVAWTAEVDGAARGLAVAGGRLYVSTDKGILYAFGAKRAEQPRIVEGASGKPAEEADDAAAQAADAILKAAGTQAGYCLDLGCGDGRLTMALAKRSKLQIYAVDPDPAKVNALRQRLDAAGWYGVRATVHQAPLEKVPYPRWFADLIVSGRSLDEGLSIVPRTAVERFQRPCGGVICLGKPGAMQVASRGPLEGAGAWTHQYADAANSLCSDDARLRGPLAALWFRETDIALPNRHGRPPAPLVQEGRMFVEGLDRLRAVNIYNGRTLWEHPLPKLLEPYHQEHLMGVAGTGSNLCLHGDRIFLADEDHCTVLSTVDGSKVAQFQSPPRPDGKPGRWRYLACAGDTLLGSLANEEHLVRHRFLAADMSQQFTESLLLFALDARSGERRWTFTPRDSVRNNAIAVGGGRVYLIDRELAAADDPRIAAAKAAAKAAGGPAPRPPEHKPGRLLALDLATGKVLWETGGAFGTMLALSVQHDALLMCYQPTAFKLDSEQGVRMAAYRASDGKPLWDVAAKYASRPIVNGRTIYAQPGAWDLLSGQEVPFRFTRSYGCGILASASQMLVFRSATLGYVDLAGKRETENYGGIRPGCWVNAIPAGGLVLLADAATGCTCSYLNQATLALQPAEQ